MNSIGRTALNLFILFLSLSPDPLFATVIEKIEGSDTLIAIIFNVDVDTTINPNSTFEIFPYLSGKWWWYNQQNLLFIPDSTIPDTSVYILSVPSSLKDAEGNAIGDFDLVFTVAKKIHYTLYKVPFQWEGNGQWEIEGNWMGTPNIYTLKPRLHPSYRKVIEILFCWKRLYRGSLKNKTDFIYPHFVSSERQNYKVSADSNGFLYLHDKAYGLKYRWYFFPEKQYYWDIDVSNNGEILIATASNSGDEIIVYLISPDGIVKWTKKFSKENNKSFALCFLNNPDKFLIYHNYKLFCFKILRE